MKNFIFIFFCFILLGCQSYERRAVSSVKTSRYDKTVATNIYSCTVFFHYSRVKPSRLKYKEFDVDFKKLKEDQTLFSYGEFLFLIYQSGEKKSKGGLLLHFEGIDSKRGNSVLLEDTGLRFKLFADGVFRDSKERIVKTVEADCVQK